MASRSKLTSEVVGLLTAENHDQQTLDIRDNETLLLNYQLQLPSLIIEAISQNTPAFIQSALANHSNNPFYETVTEIETQIISAVNSLTLVVDQAAVDILDDSNPVLLPGVENALLNGLDLLTSTVTAQISVL